MPSDSIGMSGTMVRVAASVTKPAPVTPKRPSGEHRNRQDAEFLADRQVRVGGLGEEQRRQCHVDVGAVEIEAVAGRDDEPTTDFDAPRCSIFCIMCGSTVSDELGASTISSSSCDVGDEAESRSR